LKQVKLFCLPYAGGSAAAFLNWKSHLDEKIELRPIELSGRGRRFSEPLYDSIDVAVEDIYSDICEELDQGAYAVFGHSMGTILSYELIRKIKHNKKQEPVHVFMSGRYPPYVDVEKENVYLLPDDEFLDKIVELGGTNQEVTKNKELLDLFLPILRSDYKLVETYRHEGDSKVDCDITVLNGKYDNLVIEKGVERWQEYTTNTCSFYEFEDGHFFINKFKEEVINIINNEIITRVY